jgi:acid phosphatase (class A)
MRRTLWSSLLILILATAPAAAAEATYITPDRFDLTKLLAPAPAADSELQKRDLAELLAIQKNRTPAQGERALSDATAGTFGFADVLGPNFTEQKVPTVAALFVKIRGDAAVAFSAGKDAWKRPRPFEVSKEINALGQLPGGSSYPSASSMVGFLTGIVLANMVPEKGAALFARGREFGTDRLILGVHFPSDVQAGRLAATALAAVLMQDPVFLKDFAVAKQELRQELGL